MKDKPFFTTGFTVFLLFSLFFYFFHCFSPFFCCFSTFFAVFLLFSLLVYFFCCFSTFFAACLLFSLFFYFFRCFSYFFNGLSTFSMVCLVFNGLSTFSMVCLVFQWFVYFFCFLLQATVSPWTSQSIFERKMTSLVARRRPISGISFSHFSLELTFFLPSRPICPGLPQGWNDVPWNTDSHSFRRSLEPRQSCAEHAWIWNMRDLPMNCASLLICSRMTDVVP